MPMPRLYLMFEKKDDPGEEILCNLYRLNQQCQSEFVCGAFLSLYGEMIDGIIE